MAALVVGGRMVVFHLGGMTRADGSRGPYEFRSPARRISGNRSPLFLSSPGDLFVIFNMPRLASSIRRDGSSTRLFHVHVSI